MLAAALTFISLATAVPLWPDGAMPDFQDHQVAARIETVNAVGFDAAAHHRPYLEWCAQPASNRTGQCMMLISGGGYQNLCDGVWVDRFAEYLTARGVQCVKLVYRTPRPKGLPIWQTAWEDGQRAVRCVRSEAKRRGYDGEKIGVLGFSAGGHLCAYLSNTEGYRPNASILCYPSILDTMSEKLYNHEPTNVNELVTKDTPPTFVFSTCKDNLVPIMNSTKYIEALAENDVPFEAHIFENGQHGLSLAKNATGYIETIAAQWVRLSLDWLNNEFDFNGD